MGDENKPEVNTMGSNETAGSSSQDSGGTHGWKAGPSSKSKKSRKARDCFEIVLQAKGELSVGSQLSLTQETDEEFNNLADVVAGMKKRDLQNSLESHGDDPLLGDFVKCVFRGAPPGDAAGLNRRVFTYLEVFSLAAKGKANKRNSLFNFLVTELANLPVGVVGQLVEKAMSVLSSVETNFGNMNEVWSPFEFLPALLVRIFDVPKGALDPDGRCEQDLSEMDGMAYAFHILEEVCRVNWPAGSQIMVLNTLQDLSEYFSADLMVRIFDKTLEQVKHVPFESLPQLANSAFLLLTSSGPNTKTDVQVDCLNRLIGTIEALDSEFVPEDLALSLNPTFPHVYLRYAVLLMDREEGDFDKDRFRSLLQAQGSIISNFSLVLTKDMDLARGFIKECGSSQGGLNQLSVFRTGMLLGLSRLKRLEKKVLEVLVNRIKHASSRCENSSKSSWLSAWNKRLEERKVHESFSSSSVFSAHCQGLDVLFYALEKSCKVGGWDTVIQSFPGIGIELVDMFNKYSSTQRVQRDVRIPGSSELSQSHTDLQANVDIGPRFSKLLLSALDTADPNATVAAIGMQILVSSFTDHSIVQRDLLEFIRSRLTNAAAGPSEQGICQVVRILSILVDHSPNLLLKETNMFKDILAELPRITPRVAYGILQAIQPLLRLRVDLLDFAVLVFRKALFQRDLQPRLVALNGLLLLLTCANSTNRAEQQMDVVNCIYRCFSHQSQVRVALYSGLGAALQSEDVESSVKRIILESLLGHLETMLAQPLGVRVEDSGNQSSTSSQMDLSFDTQQSDNEGEDATSGSTNYSFPILIGEKCFDRISGELLDPVYILIHVLAKVAKQTSPSFSPIRSAAIKSLSTLERRIAKSDPADPLTGWVSQEEVKVALFICESMHTFRFNSSVWNLQCRCMSRYLELRPSVAAAGMNKQKKKRTQLGSASPVNGQGSDNEQNNVAENDISGDEIVPGTVKLGAAPAGAPSWLQIPMLVQLLIWEDLQHPVITYYSGCLASCLQGARETRKPKVGASNQARICGIDDATCLDIAALVIMRHPFSVETDIVPIAKFLYMEILAGTHSATIYGNFLSCFLECLQIAIENGKVSVLMQACMHPVERSDQDPLNGEAEVATESGTSRRLPVDLFLHSLWSTVYVNVTVGSINWGNLLTVLQILNLTVPFSSEQRKQREETNDVVRLLDVKGSSKCVDAAVQLYLTAQKLASNNTYREHGEKVLANQIRCHLGKRKFDSDEEDEEEEANSDEVEEMEVCSDEGGTEEENKSKKKKKRKKPSEVEHWMILQNQKSIPPAVLSLIGSLQRVLSECEWAATLIREDPLTTKTAFDRIGQRETRKVMDAARSARADQERMLYSKLNEVVAIFTTLLETERVSEACDDQLFKALLRHYKLLGSHLKSLVAMKIRTVTKHLRQLVKSTKSQTQALYDILGSDSNQDDGGGGVGGGKYANREARVVPNLIFQIEQYEVHLIKLSKLTNASEENEPLANFVCPSLNRDFKLKSVPASGKKRSRD